jgi:hypothetical protein
MMSFDRTKPMQKNYSKSTFRIKIIAKTVIQKQITTPSLCTIQKLRYLILKQSTSPEQPNDYKNIRFELAEPKI